VQATLASARAGRDCARTPVASLLPGIMRSQDAAEGLRSFTERREAHLTRRCPAYLMVNLQTGVLA
jgi:hypothetical protein